MPELFDGGEWRRDEHSFILAMRYEQGAQWQIERRVDWDDCGSGMVR